MRECVDARIARNAVRDCEKAKLGVSETVDGGATVRNRSC